MQIDLSNKKIIITGASSGIGKAIAKSLMASGAQVAIHCNANTEAANELLIEGNNSQVFKANLGNPEEIEPFFTDVLQAFGKIDLIVHNAGIFEKHALDDSNWLEVWQKSMRVNLDAVGILTQLGINHFKENKDGGRMIYVASRAAFRGETEDYLAYAASKGGVVSLGRTVARSFGKYNIKSFLLAPGFTQTPMAQSFIDEHGEDAVLSELSLKTLTQPEDIAPIVNLIAAGLMDHATGSTIDFNAGSYVH
ncbi:SDR family NAD(P)-dependent oxidoreductase [Lacihabitans lacunae]|uniref:SDR family NAD(P)-dependent oxidoreductase n=1 Tax=Lacihabitans lacunae TaxID=1028214 RepID=A0ABV7Z1I2_9BACT